MFSKQWIENQEKMAKEFANKTGDAYIHTEINNGRPATMLCGDMICILYGIEAEINRVAELTHTKFEDVMYVISMNKKVGYGNVKEAVGEKRGTIKGSLDEMRDSLKKEMSREKEKNEKQAEDLRCQIKNAKEDLKRMKVQMEKASKEAFRECQRLQKEILRLNHENDKLTKLLRERT